MEQNVFFIQKKSIFIQENKTKKTITDDHRQEKAKKKTGLRPYI